MKNACAMGKFLLFLVSMGLEIIRELDFTPLLITFKLAFITTGILLLVGLPMAYMLAFFRFKGKSILETIVSMPIVLPPSVLGFYLMVALGPANAPGRWLEETLHFSLVFSFEGLVVGSVIFSLPFMVEPVKSGLKSLPHSLQEAAMTLGKSPWTIFFRVLLPNIGPSILTGAVISFAHTVGEFGVVLMIGGSIPGETKVASIAIYEEVEALNYDRANVYALVLFSVTFLILLLVNYTNKKAKISPL